MICWMLCVQQQNSYPGFIITLMTSDGTIFNETTRQHQSPHVFGCVMCVRISAGMPAPSERAEVGKL